MYNKTTGLWAIYKKMKASGNLSSLKTVLYVNNLLTLKTMSHENNFICDPYPIVLILPC